MTTNISFNTATNASTNMTNDIARNEKDKTIDSIDKLTTTLIKELQEIKSENEKLQENLRKSENEKSKLQELKQKVEALEQNVKKLAEQNQELSKSNENYLSAFQATSKQNAEYVKQNQVQDIKFAVLMDNHSKLLTQHQNDESKIKNLRNDKTQFDQQINQLDQQNAELKRSYAVKQPGKTTLWIVAIILLIGAIGVVGYGLGGHFTNIRDFRNKAHHH